jgi:nicotinamidase-related amidase
MDDVLILIDQQKAMEHAKWGPRSNADAQRNIARLLAAWRARKMPSPGETVVTKKVHGAFIGTDLRERLEAMGRPALVICGVPLANSVEATVRLAGNLGFTVRLPADACWSCDKRDLTGRLWPAEDVHQRTLALLDGEYATVTRTGAILATAGA